MYNILEGQHVTHTGKKSIEGELGHWPGLTSETVRKPHKQVYLKNEPHGRSQDLKKPLKWLILPLSVNTGSAEVIYLGRPSKLQEIFSKIMCGHILT